MLRNPIFSDFSVGGGGGGPDPLSPLDPRMFIVLDIPTTKIKMINYYKLPRRHVFKSLIFSE